MVRLVVQDSYVIIKGIESDLPNRICQCDFYVALSMFAQKHINMHDLIENNIIKTNHLQHLLSICIEHQDVHFNYGFIVPCFTMTL